MENWREGIWARSQKHLYWRYLSSMAVRSAYVERMCGALNEEEVVTKTQCSVFPSWSISRLTTAVKGTVHSVQLVTPRAMPKSVRGGSGAAGWGRDCGGGKPFFAASVCCRFNSLLTMRGGFGRSGCLAGLARGVW